MTTTTNPPKPATPPRTPESHTGFAKSPQTVTNAQLLKRMALFLAPVRGIAALACFFIILWASIEGCANRMTGNITNAIQRLIDSVNNEHLQIDNAFFTALQHERVKTI